MKRFQQYGITFVVCIARSLCLGIFSLDVQAEETLSFSEARHRIKEQGIRYREEVFTTSVEEGNHELAALFLQKAFDLKLEKY